MEQKLAEWLRDNKYTYISADYYEDCGTTIDLDADAMAVALIRWLEEQSNASR